MVDNVAEKGMCEMYSAQFVLAYSFKFELDEYF